MASYLGLHYYKFFVVESAVPEFHQDMEFLVYTRTIEHDPRFTVALPQEFIQGFVAFNEPVKQPRPYFGSGEEVYVYPSSLDEVYYAEDTLLQKSKDDIVAKFGVLEVNFHKLEKRAALIHARDMQLHKIPHRVFVRHYANIMRTYDATKLADKSKLTK